VVLAELVDELRCLGGPVAWLVYAVDLVWRLAGMSWWSYCAVPLALLVTEVGR
jgi:uncharacterized protein YaaW (UPF0174 family)